MVTDFRNSFTGVLSIIVAIAIIKSSTRSEKPTKTDNSRGSVATCLRCGGNFNDHFTLDLLLRVREKIVKIGQYLTRL